MKKIYFIRHAKAVEDGKSNDLERDLSERGKKDLALMCERLKKLEAEREKDENKARLCEILQVILDEEISHVSKGDRWFKFACEKEGVSPEIYAQIVQKIYPKAFLQSRELNVSARLKSGFSEAEIERIKNLSKAKKAE